MDPYDRWQEVSTIYKEKIIDLIDFLFGFDTIVSKDLLPLIQANANEILARMPNDYGVEIEGIAAVTGVELADLIFVNMAYEIFGLCTSIVAESASGTMYHGRNLDFGLYPGVNWTDVQWGLTEKLRPCLFNARMMKNGQVLYSGVFFARY